MKLSSIEVAVQALRNELANVDVKELCGADASSVLDLIAPANNQLDALALAVSARGIAVNQHNVDGSRSGAAWMAEKVGISEKQARSQLSAQKEISKFPDVAEALRSGELSLEKAAAVARGAEGDASSARILLETALVGTVEAVTRKAQELNARKPDPNRPNRLRKAQYINVRTGSDSLVRGEFCLLPQNAAGILSAYRDARGDKSYDRAESFARLLSESGKRRVEIVFHLDLVPGGNGEFRIGDRCEMKGVGPVPFSSLMDTFENASTKLVGTVQNKLVWFSEQTRRSTSDPLPEYVKRAIRAKAWDQCEVEGCVGGGDHVDHIQARVNKGINDLDNLQALCEEDHHAKTKQDAPWTAGGIYGKKRKPKPPDEHEDFRDTG